MTQKEIKADLSDGIKNWNHEIIKDVPVFYLFYYYPKDESVNQYKHWAREFIWGFKDGLKKKQGATMVTKVLQHFFLKETLSSLTLLCIPASTEKKNKLRYEDFSNIVTSNCNMSNSYEHVELKYNRDAKHISGQKDFDNLKFNREWFKGKKVIIFDDIITSGDSIRNLKKELKGMGATVVGAITLGRTVHEDYGQQPYNEIDMSVKPEPPKPVKKPTQMEISIAESTRLYNIYKDVEKVAQIRGLTPKTIYRHLYSNGTLDANQPQPTQMEISIAESTRLYNIYKDVEKVAQIRGLKPETIYKHLFSNGTLDPHKYITESQFKKASLIYDEGDYEHPASELDKFLNSTEKMVFFYIRHNS